MPDQNSSENAESPAQTDPRSYLSDADLKHVSDWNQMFEFHARDKNRKIFFLTTTYKESKDFPLTAAVASNHIKRFHIALARDLCQTRHLELPRFRKIEPILIAFLDVPGSKPKHYKYNSVPDEGSTFHHHCILIADEQHVPFLDTLDPEKYPRAAAAYAKKLSAGCRPLRTLDVQRVRDGEFHLLRVTDYCTYYSRKRTDDHRLQVFPISDSEFKKQ